MLTRSFEGSSFRRFIFAILGAMAIAAPDEGNAQVNHTEIVPLQSTTLTDQEFLNGRKDGEPVTLAGALRLPRRGPERLPVIILLHGSAGVGGFVTDWETDLNAMGVATFVLDSFTARQKDPKFATLGRFTMIVDAYRALDMVAKHPRIDPARIAVMGFSRGGAAALYASMKRFQHTHLSAGQEFAAYIPFYTGCNVLYRDDEDIADKPLRLFHGIDDDNSRSRRVAPM